MLNINTNTHIIMHMNHMSNMHNINTKIVNNKAIKNTYGLSHASGEKSVGVVES